MASPTQEFTSKNLGWMRRFRRQFGLKPDNGPVPRKRQEWVTFLGDLEGHLASESFGFENVRVSQLKRSGKTRQIISTKSLNEVLVLRRMNENIRRAYGVKNASRSALVRTLRQALQEGTRKSILRVDIKSCFESISKAMMMRKLISDGLVSFQTLSLLGKLFNTLDARPAYRKKKGLPRGLALSSTLAEILLLDLERSIRALPGVYLVIRYVDDMVILSSHLDETLHRTVKALAASHRLRLNPKKTELETVACDCDYFCSHGDFCPCKKSCSCDAKALTLEYLGYSFHFSSRNSKAINPIKVGLSKAKMAKIKTRIALASRAYVLEGDYSLLLNRIAYIVGNLQLMSSEGNRGLSTGLSYTHSEYGVPREEELKDGDLASLNDFLRNSIRGALKARPPVPPESAADLLKYDFISGFHVKRRVKLTSCELAKIGECWRYV